MKIYSLIAITAVLLAGLFSDGAWCEQTQRDMFATVVILPKFKLSVDNANIRFGFAEPGKSVELYPEMQYNEIQCISNKGNPWYLKLSIMGSIRGPEGSSVEEGCFKWMVVQSSGDGVITKDWRPFSDTPSIAYTSGQVDQAGEPVKVQFKYRLDLPETAKGGMYSVSVLYTMTDVS